ncbi:MAG: ABC transporter ATP-binding protein [Burkholderiaceae bacterium]|nr:ABC transporter ATP-binding protein [Burkholderiaceae bacterium]
MTTDIAIRVQNLSKCYQIYDNPGDRLKEFVAPRIKRLLGMPHTPYYREFWALNDISFEVKRGETVGIIGRNGSGKSTLLQIICGTLTPTRGEVQTNGRVAALLELGAGFNPEFTGRENVYLNAAVLGLSQAEIEARFDAIAAFADIGAFIDQPVKTYSSGMGVRLAFAVQSQIDPDIFIVDEALSVGDAKFQAKCFDRLRQLKENGTCILLVTHSSEQIVSHCSSAILLNQGIQLESGKPKDVVNRYLDLLFGKEKSATTPAVEKMSDTVAALPDTSSYQLSNLEDTFAKRPGYNPHEYRWGDGTATILDYFLAAEDDHYPTAVSTGQNITLAVSIKLNQDFHRPILGITIKTKEGITVYGVNSETLGCTDFGEAGQIGAVIQAHSVFKCNLAAGDYFISLGLATKHGEEVIPHDRRYDSIHLQVRPTEQFFGLADLGLTMTAKKIVQ